MINKYLEYIQEEMVEGYNRPKILYHAADKLTKTLKPRVTNLKTSTRGGAHHTNAIFAAEIPLYAFGLERVNMMIPKRHTEKLVRSWKKGCYLSPEHPNLYVYFWNHIPTKPVYMYTVRSEGFKPFVVGKKTKVTHWYNESEVIPLKVEKIYPNKLKNKAWKIATDEDWEFKIKKYIRKGFFK